MANAIVELFASVFEQAGEMKLIEILQKQHDRHLEQWKATIYGGLALTNGLKKLVTETKSKIDDAIIRALDDALRQSAANNGLDPNVQVMITAKE